MRGSGVFCLNCIGLQVKGSTFTGMSGMKGGAIYIEENSNNKLTTDTIGKYSIYSSTFS